MRQNPWASNTVAHLKTVQEELKVLEFVIKYKV